MVEAASVTDSFVHPEDEHRTTYKVTKGGVVVPPRQNNFGRSPAFDAKNLLNYVPVQIYDGDKLVASLPPGSCEENPQWKKIIANETPQMSGPLPSTPPPQGRSAHSTFQDSQSPSSGQQITNQNQLHQFNQTQDLMQKLQSLDQHLNYLNEHITSLTRSIDDLKLQVSTLSNSQTPKSSDPHFSTSKIHLQSDLGSILLEVLEICVTDQLVVLILDPEKPYIIPKSGPVIIRHEGTSYRAVAHELHFFLKMFQRDLLFLFFVREE